MDIHIGESREVLTGPSKIRILRVSRRTALIFGGVFVCAAAAIGTMLYTFTTPTTTTTNTSPSTMAIMRTGNRLPTALKPIHYIVNLMPFISSNFTIVGSVAIEFEVKEATHNITLNIHDIITRNETVKVTLRDEFDPGIDGLTIYEHLYNHKLQTYTATLMEPLQKTQRYIISMEFEGYLNDKLKGFYRSSYPDEDGKTKYLAVSQFEPADARLAFPCFDEPSLKATFDIRLAREQTKSSISNMPLGESSPFIGQPGWVWDLFNTSVPMSTYLVAFVVSDFAYVESDVNNHVHFRVWARKEAIGQTEYALATGPAVLSIFEDYFDVPFPLPKQDMIALPDFSAGAMENWGLVTYRETLLLMNPHDYAVSNKEDIARVIAHELAHQWFGNLVTLKWWNDLWLNEGFATFVSYIGTSQLEPEWRTMDAFVTDEMQGVMGLDSMESSHPISVMVENADQVNSLFDGISYSKGASIIRMMMFFLKEENFKTGIHNYLVNKQYDNAEQDDLWNFLTEAVVNTNLLPPDASVKTIMDTWTLQMGFPVINVERSPDGTTATVTQNRFLLVKNANSTNDHEYRWWVPLTYTTEDLQDFEATHPNTWMADTDKQITVSSLSTSDKWVIFNLQETGYYKVNYDINNWRLLTEQLHKNYILIHVLNRAQLVDDSLDLARASELPYDTALNLISYLSNEEDYFPWKSALDNLGYVEEMFTRTAGYGDLRMYLLSLLEPLYNLVGFHEQPDNPLLVHYKRSLALSWTCKLGYQDCVDNSAVLFQAWMASGGNTSVISPNLRRIVYCTGIAEGGEEAWNFAWQQYLSTNVANQRDKLLSALGCAKEVWILSRYLDMAFTEGSGIRKQDAGTVFRVVARNDIGRDIAWNYLRDRWQEISHYFESFTTLGDLIIAVAEEFNTKEEEHQLRLFKEEHQEELSTAELAIDQALERTSNNIAWMNTNYQTIVDWLHNHLHPHHDTITSLT